MSAFARGLRASLALALLALVLRAPRAAADESGTVDAASAASRSANATGRALGASSILATARGVSEYVVRVRRELHRAPELMWTERNTSALIKRELAAMGVAHSDLAPPGVVATIGTGAPPSSSSRADMDALPLTEEADIPEHLRSEIDGKMHACGHDGHVAMLLGAARVLKASEPDLPPGTILLAFQPDEEGGAGAKRMLEAGLAAIDPPVDTAFALHNWPYPETPSGVVGTRAVQSTMAGSGSFGDWGDGRRGHAAHGTPSACEAEGRGDAVDLDAAPRRRRRQRRPQRHHLPRRRRRRAAAATSRRRRRRGARKDTRCMRRSCTRTRRDRAAADARGEGAELAEAVRVPLGHNVPPRRRRSTS